MTSFYQLPFIRKFSVKSWKNLASLSGVQLATIFMGLLTSVLWVRYLSKETYGQYKLVLSFLTIVLGICLPGMSESLTISAAKKFDGNLKKIFNLKLVAGLVGSIILIGIGSYYWSSDPEIAIGVFIIAGFFTLRQLETLWAPWVNGKGNLVLLAKFQLLLLIPGILSVSIVIGFNLLHLYYVLIISQSIWVIFILLILYYNFSYLRENQLEDKKTIHYGFFVSGISLLGLVTGLDKFIIDKYLSVEDVAIYSVAMIFPSQMKYLFSIFAKIFTPHLYAALSVNDAWEYLRSRLIIVWCIFGIIGIEIVILVYQELIVHLL